MRKFLLTFLLLVFAVFTYGTTIYDIQYTTEPGDEDLYPSTYDGQEVTFTGIVTGANYNNNNLFYISDPVGGPWHGVFVYDFEVGPALGDELEVTGTVQEYYGLTEIADCTSIVILSSGNTVPDPIDISTIDLALAETAEQYEGCLVRVSNVEVVEAQSQYGEWYVDDGSYECQIDDGFFYLDSVNPPIVIEVGDFFPEIIGCVDYSYDYYGINPRTPEDMGYTETTDPVIPVQHVSMTNYPNPFNPETTIAFELKESDNVELVIYGINGQKIKTLTKDKRPSGRHIIMWDGTSDQGDKVTSGVYLYKLTTSSGYSSSKKMILLK